MFILIDITFHCTTAKSLLALAKKEMFLFATVDNGEFFKFSSPYFLFHMVYFKFQQPRGQRQEPK